MLVKKSTGCHSDLYSNFSKVILDWHDFLLENSVFRFDKWVGLIGSGLYLWEIMHLEVVRWAGFPLAGPELLLDPLAPLGAGWGVASPPEGVGLRARLPNLLGPDPPHPPPSPCSGPGEWSYATALSCNFSTWKEHRTLIIKCGKHHFKGLICYDFSCSQIKSLFILLFRIFPFCSPTLLQLCVRRTSVF